MKIGIDVSSIIYGTGVSDYTVNLVNHLPKESITPIGFSLRRWAEIKKLLPDSLTYPIPPTLLSFLWNRLHIIPVETFMGQVDIFHSSDWTQPPAKARKITTVHDLAPFIYPQFTSPEIVKTHTARMRWVNQECDKIICVSKNTASDLQRLFKIPSEKISVIYEAVPDKLLLTPHKPRYTNYFLAMGSRQPRKNIDRLIRAYKLGKFPQKLVITGESSLNSADPQIIFTGHVSSQELVNLYAFAEVFIYPSFYEGFGQPVLEGFYFGVPVVAANTSSIPEVAGEAAILVDPFSEKSIATGITEAIRQKQYLIASGKKQLQKFSWEKTATETLKVYNSLL